jgi:hypothetical protein
MEITLQLTAPEAALLRALAPRGAAAVKTETPLQDTALRILTSGMQREATMRRINTGTVLGVALVEAARRRRER